MLVYKKGKKKLGFRNWVRSVNPWSADKKKSIRSRLCFRSGDWL